MIVALLPYMLGPSGKWMGMTIRDFAKQFKNPFMREVMSEGLPNAFFFEPDMSLMVVLSTLAYLHVKSAGYPIGGAPKFVSSIEQRYHDLGGEIHYKSPVAKILVEADPSGQGDRAVGVRLADGTEHCADIVISAADGHTTLFDMLEGKYLNDKIRGYYDSLPLFHPIFFISLGVNRTFEKKPPSIAGEIFPLDGPIHIAGRECGWLAPHIYDFDSSLAPKGKTLMRVMLPADYEYWSNLRKQDHERYKKEKQQIADQVIARLDKRFPGLADQVEMCDVATPATFERYTGNWQASWMGWLYTAKTMRMSISKTLPGLDNFYMVGTWVLNSGLPFAAVSGRHVTQILCKKDNKPFVTTVP
jgi:phytoene dehydrogenase-like protein